MTQTAFAIEQRKLRDLRIEIIEDAAAFAQLRVGWNALLASSRSNTLFLTCEWLHTWWMHLGQDRRLFIVTIRSGSELVAIAPLTMTRSLIPVLEFAGTGSVGSDYLDFIVDPACEAEVVPALAAFLADTGLTLRLPRVKEDSVASTLQRILQGLGWTTNETNPQACPYVDLAGTTWESYLAGLTRKHRSNFTRTQRNLERDYKVDIHFGTSLEHLIDLHLMRRKNIGGSDAFHTSQLIAFHESFSAIALERGWLRLLEITLNDRVAGALYCFRYGRSFIYYQSGFDPEFHAYGLGQLMVGLTIRKAFEEGALEYDFLHGAEPYKFNWTSTTRRLRRLGFFPPSRIGRMHHAATKTVAATKTFVKSCFAR